MSKNKIPPKTKKELEKYLKKHTGFTFKDLDGLGVFKLAEVTADFMRYISQVYADDMNKKIIQDKLLTLSSLFVKFNKSDYKLNTQEKNRLKNSLKIEENHKKEVKEIPDKLKGFIDLIFKNGYKGLNITQRETLKTMIIYEYQLNFNDYFLRWDSVAQIFNELLNKQLDIKEQYLHLNALVSMLTPESVKEASTETNLTVLNEILSNGIQIIAINELIKIYFNNAGIDNIYQALQLDSQEFFNLADKYQKLLNEAGKELVYTISSKDIDQNVIDEMMSEDIFSLNIKPTQSNINRLASTIDVKFNSRGRDEE